MAPPIVCSAHEDTPTALVCYHMARAVRLRTEVPPFQRMRASVDWLKIDPYICSDCMHHFDLMPQFQVPIEGELDGSRYPKLFPVCWKCFADSLGDLPLGRFWEPPPVGC